jgi:hypothetical protein
MRHSYRYAFPLNYKTEGNDLQYWREIGPGDTEHGSTETRARQIGVQRVLITSPAKDIMSNVVTENFPLSVR